MAIKTENNKTSVFANGLIWFGAAVSIAEILTGTLLAPLGFAKGLTAVLLGHLIGCALLFFAGLIGGRTGKSAMETVRLSFGKKGALLFSSLNVLQLVGWTAVMIVSAAYACDSVLRIGGSWVWCAVIAALIILWVFIGITNLGRLNTAAMAALFALTVVLSTVVFRGAGADASASSAASALSAATGGGLSFGAAVELSAAMPLSWLPLISDYTRAAKKPVAATTASALVYFFVSSWMYVIGLGAAIFTGESDVTAILLKAGLPAVAMVIVIFSTVTTTFLDVYSAGVSSVSISKRLRERPAAIAVCLVGAFLAAFTPITQFENFLYLIGSVFAPMIAIQIVDYFILRKDSAAKELPILNLALWAAGFAIYRLFLLVDTPVGNTLPVMLITGLLCLLANRCVELYYAAAKRSNFRINK
ncbi:MAG: putative hydroxymethylpyrimidine transporter CytX [Clostridiales bacterium]|jgi:putative hydroxymethylpyrimidine transporter CytX|nr:putative hydroxymethylpyrimidine transporter CytX [Clostridiales bacterium]